MNVYRQHSIMSFATRLREEDQALRSKERSESQVIDPSIAKVMDSDARKRAEPWEGVGRRD